MADRKTQSGEVLNHFKKVGHLSSIEAINLYGCTRLPARVSDYKKRGYRFRAVWVTNKTRYGTSTRYVNYIFEGKDDEENQG